MPLKTSDESFIEYLLETVKLQESVIAYLEKELVMNDKTEIATKLICVGMQSCTNITAKDITKYCKFAQQIIDECKTPEDVVPEVTTNRKPVNMPTINPWVTLYLSVISAEELADVSDRYMRLTGNSIVGLVFQTLEYLRTQLVEHGNDIITDDYEVWYRLSLEKVGTLIYTTSYPTADGYAYKMYIKHPESNICFKISGDRASNKSILMENADDYMRTFVEDM